jgi:hypothetical protein
MPCRAFQPTPASRPAAAPAAHAPLGVTQAPRAPRTVPPNPAICHVERFFHRSLQHTSKRRPSHGSAHPLPLRPNADRTPLLRTPRPMARPWTRRSSAPTASSAVDAQPACTAGRPSLATRHALSQRVARRLLAYMLVAPRYAQNHKQNRLAPALGLEIPRLPPTDSPSWSCTVGAREDPPTTTPDHLPSPSARPPPRKKYSSTHPSARPPPRKKCTVV